MRTTSADRESFRRIIERSELPISVFTEWVLGRNPSTGFRYLSGGEIPHSALLWLRHLESVEHRGDEVRILLKWSPPNRRWWPFVEHGNRRTFMREERRL